MVTFLVVFQMSCHKTHPGTKYVVKGGRGLARFFAKTIDKKASFGGFEGEVAFLGLAAPFDAHLKVAYVTNVSKVSRSFSSQQSDVICGFPRDADRRSVFSMLLSCFYGKDIIID